MCDCSKKQSRRKKISHRSAWQTEWFGLLTLVPSSRAVLTFLLATNILILCFVTVLTECLFDVVKLVQASATLRALASINFAVSSERTGSALGSAERRCGEAAWTLVTGRGYTGVDGILA